MIGSPERRLDSHIRRGRSGYIHERNLGTSFPLYTGPDLRWRSLSEIVTCADLAGRSVINS